MWGPGHGMGGWGGGWMPFGGIGFLLLVIVAVLVIGGIIRSVARPSERAPRAETLDLLDARYARGEIDREEYLQRRRDILG